MTWLRKITGSGSSILWVLFAVCTEMFVINWLIDWFVDWSSLFRSYLINQCLITKQTNQNFNRIIMSWYKIINQTNLIDLIAFEYWNKLHFVKIQSALLQSSNEWSRGKAFLFELIPWRTGPLNHNTHMASHQLKESLNFLCR